MGLLVVALLRLVPRGHRVEGCLGGLGGALPAGWQRAVRGIGQGIANEISDYQKRGLKLCKCKGCQILGSHILRLPEAGSESVQIQLGRINMELEIAGEP